MIIYLNYRLLLDTIPITEKAIYRRSYLITNFYTYEYKTRHVYRGKDLVLKIKPFVENKKKSVKFTKLTFE